MNASIVINNLLLSYNHFSSGQEPHEVLLFLHGWRSNKESWATVIDGLKKADVQADIFALDLPGFGKSETPSTSYYVQNYCDVVAAFIQKMDLKNVTLIGHSFGGRVGIKLCATQPDLVSRLVLVDSAGFVTKTTKGAALRLFAKLVKPVFKPKIMQGLRKKIYKKIGSEDYVATPELQQTFLNVVREDLSEHMPRIEQQTLLIWGENDQDTPVAFAQKMNQLVPHSELVVIERAGHYSFLDQTDEFLAHLTRFLTA